MNTIKPQDVRQVACVGAGTIGSGSVSYTHLTLPTILLV